MGDTFEVLWGQGYITDYIGSVKYQISPLSFYQVNPVQTEKLYSQALEYAGLKGDETVWDLYCGIGTISLFLAQKAKQVYGVEIVPPAIDDARENAQLNGIENAQFFVGKSEEILPKYYKDYEEQHGGEKAHADVIVVDPPRKGCDAELLETILKMQPERIVYVSCDSATLARDLKILCEGAQEDEKTAGYQIEKWRAVDQFPMTTHVETVCLLTREKSVKSYAYVDITPSELGMGGKVKKPTYKQIQAYVLETHGLKVSPLYIANVKDEFGLEKQFSYEEAGMSAKKRPNCPSEKRAAIIDALIHFGMLDEDARETE